MQGPRTLPPRTDRPEMSVAEYHDRTREIVLRLERIERDRCGDADSARRSLARKLNALPGTIESWIKGRLKNVDAAFKTRAEDMLAREIRREIGALQDELSRLTGGTDEALRRQVAAIEADLSILKASLGN